MMAQWILTIRTPMCSATCWPCAKILEPWPALAAGLPTHQIVSESSKGGVGEDLVSV
jgi:hypothetical protein